MSLKTQAKILRLLQERTFERVGGGKTIRADVRVIAATNKNLEQAIIRGEFREDLYYRLRVFPLRVPPLRDRGEDILLMLDYFTRRLQKDYALKPMTFDASARRALLRYRWPGNVRELRNFVERMLIMHSGQTMSALDLPPEISGHGPAGAGRNAEPCLADEGPAGVTWPEPTCGIGEDCLRNHDFKAARNLFEARYLEEKHREFSGNISKMAEAVGLERSYLHRKLKALGVIE